jgi:hypothetical protein
VAVEVVALISMSAFPDRSLKIWKVTRFRRFRRPVGLEMNHLFLITIIATLAVFSAGCVSHDRHSESRSVFTLNRMPEVVFLTRDGCINTPILLKNLESAAQAFSPPLQYTVVNQGTLADTDPRTAYPTPTILLANRDLFGAAQPQPPFPPPS